MIFSFTSVRMKRSTAKVSRGFQQQSPVSELKLLTWILVNHTLANLEQTDDPNPFVSEYQDPSHPHPSKGIENIKSTGWERKEVL